MPKELTKALKKQKSNLAWEKLAPSKKKILRYLNSLKTKESVDKNILKIANAVTK
ncbi:hypothetical protein HY637_05735 [Candidatus Woesearchaeota archaeon]|nr:hypothetical protein [Candidatus Woesearchaeota archaeon]